MYFQSLLKIATCLLIVSLDPCAFTEALQEISKVHILVKTGFCRKCPHLLNSKPIVLYCLWVSRQCICAIARHFCIVSDLWRISPTIYEVVGDGGGSFFFPSPVYLPQDFCSPPVEAGAPASR